MSYYFLVKKLIGDIKQLSANLNDKVFRGNGIMYNFKNRSFLSKNFEEILETLIDDYLKSFRKPVFTVFIVQFSSFLTI